MEAAPLDLATARFGLIIARADEMLAGIRARERLARRVRARGVARGSGGLKAGAPGADACGRPSASPPRPTCGA